jgi:hypothetical protein
MKFAAVLSLVTPVLGFVSIQGPVHTKTQTNVMRMVQERSTAIPFDKRPENLDGEY